MTGGRLACRAPPQSIRLTTHRGRGPPRRTDTTIRQISFTRARNTTRRVVQTASLLLFLLLAVAGPTISGTSLADAYARFDPLVGLAGSIAAREWLAFASLSLVTVALTLVFGRVWCGWVCPVGAALDILPARREGQNRRRSPAWRAGKYLTLAAVLTGAVLGWQGPMILDPITLASRPVTELLLPQMSRDAVGAVGLPPQSVTVIALASVAPLAIVLALNALGRRTWCASACPLGGMLAILSVVPVVRRIVLSDQCTSCGKCARQCPTAAIEPKSGFGSSSSECVMCTSCSASCPSDAIRFRPRPAPAPSRPYAYDPSRRRLVTYAGAGAAGILLAGPVPLLAAESDILRPPSTDEDRLARLCVRCGACYVACPTGVLRPSLSLTSRAGMWTPMLDDRPAHCSLRCNLCAVPCPTGALRTPTPDEVRRLGLDRKARVDRSRCIAWARGRACGRCLRVCPIFGALSGAGVRAEGDPRPRDIALPVVDEELCIGCDLCAHECPVDPPAIGTGADEILTI